MRIDKEWLIYVVIALLLLIICATLMCKSAKADECMWAQPDGSYVCSDGTIYHAQPDGGYVITHNN